MKISNNNPSIYQFFMTNLMEDKVSGGFKWRCNMDAIEKGY